MKKVKKCQSLFQTAKSKAVPLGLVLSGLAFGDPYQILGVSPTATKEEILQAYRQKAKAYHPDVSSLPAAEAAKEFKKIQSAYEEIQMGRRPATAPSKPSDDFDRKREIEKQQAKQKATSILETSWAQGKFTAETIQNLPVFSALKQPKTFRFGRGPNEDGEWEALSEFLKNHQEEFLKQNREPQEINNILKTLDFYSEYTGQSVRDIRNGLTAPFEMAIFEKTKDKALFLEALEDRLYRLSRAGAMSPFVTSESERKEILGEIPDLFSKRFGPLPDTTESKALQMARAAMNSAFAKIKSSPSRIHELDYLLKTLPKALDSKEQLTFLSDFLAHLDSFSKEPASKAAVADLKSRAEKRIERIFEKEPELKKTYAEKAGLWNRLMGRSTSCEIRLGKLAKRPRD